LPIKVLLKLLATSQAFFWATMVQAIEAVDEAELAVFKKKIKKLKEFSGKGTELISQYVPADADRSSVMGQLTEEMSQSANIKSPQTRKNVQGALRKISNFLKTINFSIPPNGLVVFCGNVSEREGRSDIRLFTIKPPKRLKVKLYWCDSEFHLDPLEEMIRPSDIYVLITMDKREATIAILLGKKYEIVAHYTSQVSGKFRAGGQSAKRFEHLREEAAQDFYKKISEKINALFAEHQNKIKGLIVAGPGSTKNYFLDKGLLDYRLKNKILGILDVSYTDESGIREMVQRSEEILHDTELMAERSIMTKFMEEIAKNGLVTYGQKEVEAALSIGKVGTLILSEAIEWEVFKFECNHCNEKFERIVKEPKNYNAAAEKCEKCNTEAELIEEVDYIDWMIEKAHSMGAETTRVISTETNEGEQFYNGFGGIGAMLRYR
jgi:peptide chain release factor subunit 1